MLGTPLSIMNCPSRRASRWYGNPWNWAPINFPNVEPVTQQAKSDYAANSGDVLACYQRLKKAVAGWQKETRDPLADPELLEKLMTECREVTASKKRSPSGGWKYLDYLHPDKLR